MLITAENIWFRYETEPADSFVLKDVSFTLNPGECVALVGPSGSGKSTLAQILNGLLRPDCGRLLIAAQPLEYKPKPLRDLRRRIGLVFQLPETQIFEATVFDEVAFAARQCGIPASQIQSRVATALEMVGLDPDSYSNRNPLKLSGGEARLVTVASLLVINPDWLILDEPTLGLDSVHTRLIVAMIQKRHHSSRGVLLITHDLDLALSLDSRTVVLNDGKIVFEGAAEELLVKHDLRTGFGLAEPESLRLWKLLRNEVAGFALGDRCQIIAAVAALPMDQRQQVKQILQKSILAEAW